VNTTELSREEVKALSDADNPEGSVILAVLVSPKALLGIMTFTGLTAVTVVDAPENAE
jgi:hypothetical protein